MELSRLLLRVRLQKHAPPPFIERLISNSAATLFYLFLFKKYPTIRHLKAVFVTYCFAFALVSGIVLSSVFQCLDSDGHGLEWHCDTE
jgi:hypothetical protein